MSSMQELLHKANGWPPPGKPMKQGKPDKKAQKELRNVLLAKGLDQNATSTA